MRKENRMKIMALATVLLMTLCSVAVFMPENNDLDAVVGDNGSYSYTITYDPTLMSTTSAAISVADMTPISHTGSPTTVSSMNAGSWTWNTTTGIGPFNSFYAAFDLTDGNKFYAILNPNNLMQTIDGVTLNPISNYNIMWVLPTVYISSTATTLTLSNDPNDGVAYAHTINGHTYRYVAYGVYEGSTTSLGGTTVLTSTSGTMPATNHTKTEFRTYAHNYAMDSSLNTGGAYSAYSMLWNFDQWQLFRSICWTVTENLNSQNTVGNGYVYSNPSVFAYQTGYSDTYGPYMGLPALITDNETAALYGASGVKLFIENSWGGLGEFVDGIIFDGLTDAYIDSSNNPTDTNSGQYVTHITWTVLSNQFPVSIQSSDSRIWGYAGSTGNGTSTTGLADFQGGSGALMDVSGTSWTAWATSVRYGMNYVNKVGNTSFNYEGSRLAFVFDADLTHSDLTVNIDPSGYGTLSSGAQTGLTTFTISDINNYSTISVSNNTLTVGSTTVTAVKTSDDDHWTYSFDGWYSGTSKITSSTTITSDMTITAKFTRTLTLHDAQVESNNTSWGTVSVGQLTGIPYGETFTVSDHTLTIYGQSVVAVESPDTVVFEYSFDGFETEGVQITTGMAMTKDLTIRAIFTSAHQTYVVILHSNNTAYGTVDVASVMNVPSESEFTVNGNSLEIAGTYVTATKHTDDAQYTYSFDGWYDALTGGNAVVTGTTVMGNMDVYARFSATVNNYTVTIQDDSSGYGSVSPTTVSNVPYGTVITSNLNTLDVNGTTVTATPTTDTDEYDYKFTNWTVGQNVMSSYTVTGNTTIVGNFTRDIQTYTVSFASNNDEYGSVSPSFVINVPYGSTYTVTNNTLRVNGTTATATPAENDEEWTYAFVEWSVDGTDSVQGNTTVTATFSRTHTVYTVTVLPNNSDYGSVTNPTYSNVPYGTVITVDGDEVEIGNIDTSEAVPREDTAQYNYGFSNWSVGGSTITTTYTVIGNTNVIANFTRDLVEYTITWDVDGITSTETYDYGAIPTHTAPAKANYDFAGWSPAIAMVTQDQTYTATWTPIVYTVTFEGTGGTPSVNYATGTVLTAVVLPDCILADNYLEGWYTSNNTYIGFTGDDYFPTANITLYAKWTYDVVYHFSVVYNSNGGEGTPATQTYMTTVDTELTHDFVVSSTKPFYGGYDLVGWATAPDAEEAEYKAGDLITVAANSSITLYAVWEMTDSYKAIKDIIGLIPYLVIIGLILAIVGVIFKRKDWGIENETLIGLILGAAIAIVAVALIMIPLLASV